MREIRSKAEYEALCDEVWHHNRCYFQDAAPEISDEMFDALTALLERTERDHPEWISPTSPTQRIGEKPLEGFDEVVHAAVMAGILTGLPAFRVRLVVFDTSVVDLSDRVADPVEVLLSVQLGGGTHIAQAVRYCAGLVENPHRTILVLVTDFCEGVPPSALYGAVRELAEARVRMIGLAALDGQAQPFYDRRIAGALADLGMEIAALTPGQLAQWLVEVTA